MAERLTTDTSQRRVGSSLRVRYRLTPWWVRVLLVYLGARLITTVFVVLLADVQGPNAWTGPRPGYFDFASIWDGRWYNIIAQSGYPTELPITDTGTVAENAWAFMPGYPVVCAVLMQLTGLSWQLAAVIVSFVFGAGAALMFYRLMRTALDGSTSLFATVLFCVAPVSPLMQFAYAESMYFFFLALALYFLVQRHYLLLFPIVAVMAVTRPSGLAFALTMCFHWVYRFIVRARDPFTIRDRVVCGILAIFSACTGFAWLLIAAFTTGSFTAYTDTELAWRIPYIGEVELIPFTAWFQGAHWWFTTWLGWPSWSGPAVLLVILFLIVVFLFSPPVKKLGVDIRLWVISYSVYVLAVFFPQSSTFRILAPLFPLWGALAQPKHLWYRVSLVVLCIAAQWGWLLLCWRVTGADWSPP
jgi:hypothetical protein